MAEAASTADLGDGAKAVEFYLKAFSHFQQGMEKATEAGDDDDSDGQVLEASLVIYFLAFDFCPVNSTLAGNQAGPRGLIRSWRNLEAHSGSRTFYR